MIPPTFTISANDQTIVAHFDALPRAIRLRLRSRIVALTQTLLGLVHAAEPRRTGRLRALTRAFIDERPDRIRGRVRILGTPMHPHNVAAAALNYGVHRAVRVRAHSARISQVFGERVTPQTILIRAHTRRVDIRARRFLQGPVQTIRSRVRLELEEALREALTQARR